MARLYEAKVDLSHQATIFINRSTFTPFFISVSLCQWFIKINVRQSKFTVIDLLLNRAFFCPLCDRLFTREKFSVPTFSA